MTNKVVYLDTETTGLNPNIHHVWEIALITDDGEEHSWMVRPDLTHADPNALRIGGYWDRFRVSPFRHPESHIAAQVARLLADAVVIGSNPAFDKEFLAPWLREHGQVWAAHYRTVDVVTLGAGGVEPPPPLPWSSHAISRVHGVEPDDYDRHTALGDCRWVAALHKAITSKGADQ